MICHTKYTNMVAYIDMNINTSFFAAMAVQKAVPCAPLSKYIDS